MSLKEVRKQWDGDSWLKYDVEFREKAEALKIRDCSTVVLEVILCTISTAPCTISATPLLLPLVKGSVCGLHTNPQGQTEGVVPDCEYVAPSWGKCEQQDWGRSGLTGICVSG